jgi:hypothetical protein
MPQAIAILGSTFFFVVAPCVFAGLGSLVNKKLQGWTAHT